MKKIIKEYWFQISWSLAMSGAGIWIFLEQGLIVSIIPFALALGMSSLPLFNLFDLWKKRWIGE